MRGVGGPLLCIGDLLGDVGEPDTSDNRHNQIKSPPTSSSSHPDLHFQPSDLSKLFQVTESYVSQNGRNKKEISMTSEKGVELCATQGSYCKFYCELKWLLMSVGILWSMDYYDQLNKALSGTDHSWTSLTLKLCSALDTAKKLIESTNSNVTVLSEKVEELEKIIKKEDSAIAEVRSIHSLLSQRIASFSDSQA